jgi:NAD(P)H-dependent FMN reductase/ketosteroid isomerase-like protein
VNCKRESRCNAFSGRRFKWVRNIRKEKGSVMSKPITIAVIVGSLRRASFTRKIAEAAMALAPRSLDCRIVEIDDLPLYNEDLDGDPPSSWERFRSEIASVDGFLFLTPEYNRSVPACLKNALDVGSRPEGKNVWAAKPAGIISVTPYQLGGFGANHAVRQALVYLNIPAMQQPEAYISKVKDLLDENGKLNDQRTARFLTKFMVSLHDWVATIRGVSKAKSDFQTFLARDRRQAAEAYSRGDAGPLDAIVPTEGDATFFHPHGEIISGPMLVKERYDKDAKSFGGNGTTTLDIKHQESAGLAFWAGIQSAEVEVGGKKQSMSLRITEVFRNENGLWRLVHRHADVPKS